MQINIPQSEVLNQSDLLKSCQMGSSPFSMALPRLGVLKIKAEVDPESLKITWVQWLEIPAVLRDNQFPVFEIPQYFVSSQLSESSLRVVSEPLSPRAEPEAYPPGGTFLDQEE